METEFTKASHQLDHRIVGKISGHFLVPEYQRGYRWGPYEVNALLDDIWSNGEKPYSLQPVVVVKGDADTWELVDGQQRLTTLYLIFLYIQRHHLPSAAPPFSLHYRTRPETEAFLKEPDSDRARENADFFHLFGAWEVIGSWFAARAEQEGGAHQATHVAMEFFSRLNKYVRVIWYEAEEVEPRQLFARLNIGRIPLTSAELVKALLLARSEDEPVAIQRAAQWDAIEQDLREPEFWAFLTNAPATRHPTRIGLLLDLLAKRPAGRNWRRYQTFDELRERIDSSTKHFWSEVLDVHAQLREWFDNPDRYHQVGYLVATGDEQELAKLVALAADARRSAVAARLVSRIRARAQITAETWRTTTYKKSEQRRCGDLLLLANVELSRKQRGQRYPFDRHKGVRSGWTLEHIHAQQSEGLDAKGDWDEWLDLHVEALATLPAPPPDEADPREALRERIITERDGLTRDSFRTLAADVIALFSAGGEVGSDWVHSMANLTLLPGDANTALGNAVFAVKRQRILELDRAGTYIPPCTRRVFLKYYDAKGVPQLQFWTAADRSAYDEAMLSLLAPYFSDSQ